jgi:outer membrane receptor protein involved in Fe transport
VQTQGVDLATTWQVAPGWRWSASYSWFDFEVVELPVQLIDVLLPNAPPHSATTGVAYATPRYDAALDLRWVDGFPWAVGTFRGHVDTYTTADASANYRLTPQVTVGVHAANVFDHRHWQSFGGDLLRRRILGTVRYEW